MNQNKLNTFSMTEVWVVLRLSLPFHLKLKLISILHYQADLVVLVSLFIVPKASSVFGFKKGPWNVEDIFHVKLCRSGRQVSYFPRIFCLVVFVYFLGKLKKLHALVHTHTINELWSAYHTGQNFFLHSLLLQEFKKFVSVDIHAS